MDEAAKEQPEAQAAYFRQLERGLELQKAGGGASHPPNGAQTGNGLCASGSSTAEGAWSQNVSGSASEGEEGSEWGSEEEAGECSDDESDN
jgi:hypothetical protein